MTNSTNGGNYDRDIVDRVVRTFLGNGYSIESFDRPAAATFLVQVSRRDPIGAQARAVIAFATGFPRALQDRLVSDAKRASSLPVVVWLEKALPAPKGIPAYHIGNFLDLLGGEVRTDRIFRPDLPAFMNELGHNRLPTGMTGNPDELLEIYGADAFQYLMECPVRRYGQDRLFEPLPDALALGRSQFNLHVDAKAYATEFHPSADDIRRFTSYVNDFNLRYKQFVGPISLFLVVSGSFSSDQNAIREKARDLLSSCGTPLALMRAEDLGKAVDLLRTAPPMRAAVNWRRVLIPEVFSFDALEEEISRIKRDAIIS
jgi:hypothetical protein